MKNKVAKFRLEKDNLETKVINEINKLRSLYPKVPFLSKDDEDGGDDYFEVRNDLSGNVFDVFILNISERGIKVIEVEDLSTTKLIGLHDFTSLSDRISLYELLLIQIEKFNEFLKTHGIKVRINEPLSYVEIMVDNHKVIEWGKFQYYIPEDTPYTQKEAFIFDLLVEYNHV